MYCDNHNHLARSTYTAKRKLRPICEVKDLKFHICTALWKQYHCQENVARTLPEIRVSLKPHSPVTVY